MHALQLIRLRQSCKQLPGRSKRLLLHPHRMSCAAAGPVAVKIEPRTASAKHERMVKVDNRDFISASHLGGLDEAAESHIHVVNRLVFLG